MIGITRAGRKEGSRAGWREVGAGRPEFGGIKKMGKVVGGDLSSSKGAPAHSLRCEAFLEMYS